MYICVWKNDVIHVNHDQPVQFCSQHKVGIYTRKSESREHSTGPHYKSHSHKISDNYNQIADGARRQKFVAKIIILRMIRISHEREMINLLLLCSPRMDGGHTVTLGYHYQYRKRVVLIASNSFNLKW